MSYPATVYRILVASPSDVIDERRAIPEIIHQWNRDNAFLTKTVLDAVKWETHGTPEMGNRPQEIINRQVVRDCDVLVGVFWTRLGSPTGREKSGTVEEIHEFIAAGKPVLLYFSKMPVALDSVDAEQWSKLKGFKEECRAKGLVYEYDNFDELRELLRSHLGRTVQKLNNMLESMGVAVPESTLDMPAYDQQRAAVLSLRSDFEIFLRRVVAEWAAERDSDPFSLDDAKLLLRRIADELIEYRSRIASDMGQLSKLLAETTKRIKSLQRHDVYLDGGRSYREFWEKGDEILFILQVVPALLDDELQDTKKNQERTSMTRAAIEEIEFNLQYLTKQGYSTAITLRTTSVDNFAQANPQLPERLMRSIRTYVRNIQSARDVHVVTVGAGGDVTPELIRIEDLLKSAQTAGKAILGDINLFLQYADTTRSLT